MNTVAAVLRRHVYLISHYNCIAMAWLGLPALITALYSFTDGHGHFEQQKRPTSVGLPLPSRPSVSGRQVCRPPQLWVPSRLGVLLAWCTV